MNRTGYLLAMLIIALAAIGTMWPLVHADFTNWDDPHTVSENSEMLPPTLPSLGRLWQKPRADLYVPVTYSFWWTIGHIADSRDEHGEWQLSPRPFHVANIVLHTLSSLLVFSLLRRLIPNTAAACVGAILFAVHPVQVETVAWISGAKDLLCGLLSLTAIHQYICYAQTSNALSADPAGKRRIAMNWVVACVAIILAMLAKPAAVMVPWICFAIDRAVIRPSWKDTIRGAAPLVLATIPFVALAHFVQPATLNTTLVSPALRPMVALDAIAFYLGKLFWPATLTVDYARHPKAIVASGAIWWTWLIPAFLAILVIRICIKRRRVTLSALGLIIAALAIAPVLGLVPFDYQEYSTVADHYLYLPMLGVSLSIAALLCTAMMWCPFRLLAMIFACTACTALAIRSSAQTRVWQNSKSLFAHQIAARPESFLGYNNIVRPLLDEGRLDDAAAMARRSIALRPDNSVGWMNIGYVDLETHDLPSAIEAFRKSIQLQSRQGSAIEARVNLADALGQAGDLDGAIDEYRKVLAIDPHNRIAMRMLPKALGYRASLKKKN